MLLIVAKAKIIVSAMNSTPKPVLTPENLYLVAKIKPAPIVVIGRNIFTKKNPRGPSV